MEEASGNIAGYYSEYSTKAYGNAEIYSNTKVNFYYDICQRVIDLLLASMGLIIGIPLMIIFGIAIILETSGPAIYKQERVGKNGKKFVIYKLRSMGIDAEKNGAQWAQKRDPRVTRIGAFIRKTRIDEIPQIFNVLKGEMSIVGPRPERPNFTMDFNKEIPGFIYRLQVKPGLTGWAQVTGGYDMTPKEKWEADMYYIKNRSMILDLWIILKTVRVVITGQGAR